MPKRHQDFKNKIAIIADRLSCRQRPGQKSSTASTSEGEAKAALTAVKTICNSIYIVPTLQAEIDMMSGLIAADEKDYTTAYSYFYETFEGYRSMNEIERAGGAFKFMLFSKIMNRQSEDALNLMNSAISLKY